MTENNKPVVIP